MGKRKRLNRNQVIEAIRRLDVFESHTKSMWSAWSEGVYYVYSYNTPIGACDGTHWRFNAQKYSPTTSRHQSYLKRGARISDCGISLTTLDW